MDAWRKSKDDVTRNLARALCVAQCLGAMVLGGGERQTDMGRRSRNLDVWVFRNGLEPFTMLVVVIVCVRLCQLRMICLQARWLEWVGVAQNRPHVRLSSCQTTAELHGR